MAKKNYKTWIQGELVSPEILNEQIRDNGNEIWQGEQAGDMDYYTSATTKERIPIGTQNQTLTVVNGIPTWSDTVPGIFQAKGDLPVASGADTLARLPVGVDYRILQARAGSTNGVEWASANGAISYIDGATAIAHNTETDISVFINKLWDSGGYNASGNIAIPVGLSGAYMITAYGYWDNHATANRLRQIAIKVNGVKVAVQSVMNDGASQIYQTISTIEYLNNNDQIVLSVLQKSGASLNFNNAKISIARIR